MVARSEHLNRTGYAALRLVGPGTDLTIDLPRGHIWKVGQATTKAGIDFVPRLPWVGSFTIPHKDKTQGVVTATKPLLQRGVLIEGFRLTFREGRVVEATAKTGEEGLHKLLEIDEGASRLGEVALVPHRSHAALAGRAFYKPLIDGSLSTGVALGSAHRGLIEGGEAMSESEFLSAGGNNSLIHQAFVVGSGEMDVDGITRDGTAEPLMRGGQWAFQV
jgi:aminopeptidase